MYFYAFVMLFCIMIGFFGWLLLPIFEKLALFFIVLEKQFGLLPAAFVATPEFVTNYANMIAGSLIFGLIGVAVVKFFVEGIADSFFCMKKAKAAQRKDEAGRSDN